jgi:hypothetical protein
MNDLCYVTLNGRRHGASERGSADSRRNDLCLIGGPPHIDARPIRRALGNSRTEPKQRKDSNGKRIPNCRQFKFQDLTPFSCTEQNRNKGRTATESVFRIVANSSFKT